MRTIASGFVASALAMFVSTLPAQAASIGGGITLTFDGQCGLSGNSTTFGINSINLSAGEVPSVDETVVFPDSSTLNQDILIFYVVDAAGIVIGRYDQGFPTNLAFVGGGFFRIDQRPTVAGTQTLYLVNETDRSFDRALGSTFSGSSMASTSINAVATDPDCVPAPVADTTPPTVLSINRNNPAASPTNADSLTWAVTFSETVVNVDAADFAASPLPSGASISVSGSGATRQVTLSGGVALAGYNGTISMALTGSPSIQDSATNALTNTSPGSSQSYVLDNTIPGVGMTSVAPSPTSTSPIPVTVTFSESVTGFVVGDVQVTGGSVGSFSGSGASYSFSITPSGDGTVTANIAAGVAQDSAGNGNTAASALSRVFDGTDPGVTISSTATDPTGTSPVPITVTFSEPVSGFDLGDVVVTDGVPSGLTGSGATYSFSVTPNSGATLVRVDVSAGGVLDGAGNANTAATQFTINFDNTAPTVAISSAATSPTATAPIPVTVTFSESVTGFDVNDLSVSGATVPSFSGSGTTFNLTLLPTGDGTITVDIGSGAAQDAAANPSGAATQFSIQYDGTAPGVAISSTVTGPTSQTPIPVQVTFTEAVSGFAETDLVVVGASVSGFGGSGASYSFNLVPTGDGTITVDLAAGQATDAAGNANTAAPQFSIDFDGTAPGVSISSTATGPTSVAPIPVAITFTEAVNGFDATDVAVGGGTVSNFSGSGATFAFDLVPSGDGTLTVDIAAAVAEDSAANDNTAAATFSILYDGTEPVPSLAGTPDFPGAAYTLTIAFSEPVTGLELADFDVTNASLTTLSGSGASYTLQVTASDFAHSVQLRAATVEDAAGNPNSTSNLFQNVPDGAGPTLAIAGLPASFDPGAVFSVTFTFSEPVVGFTVADVSVSGGSITDFTGGPVSFTATVTPDGLGNLAVSIPDGAAQDVSGATSLAASANSSIESSELASEAIAEFLETRARSLLQNQPRLTRFLSGQGGGAAAASVTRSAGTLDLMSRTDGPFWMALSGSWTETDDGAETSYGLAVIGTHLTVNDGLLVGGMLQFDRAAMTTAGDIDVEGTGWLVGPYVVAQLADQQLYFEGRLLYGETDNEISPLGTFTDRFSGERWLASVGIEGNYQLEGINLFPSVALSHVRETQNSYVDGLGNTVAAQGIELTEAEFGIDLEAPLTQIPGDFVLTGGVSALWAEVRGNGAASAYVSDTEGGRARVDLGFRYSNGTGFSASGGGFLDGLGRGQEMRTHGMQLLMSLEF